MKNLKNKKKDELIAIIERKDETEITLKKELADVKTKLTNATNYVKKLADDLKQANDNVYKYQKDVTKLTSENNLVLESEAIVIAKAHRNGILAVISGIITVILALVLIF